MKKKIIIYFSLGGLFFLAPMSLKSQEIDAQEIKINEPNEIKRLIYPIFGTIVGPTNNNIIGNFSSLDISNGELSFAGNAIFENGSILGIKATGKSANGILPVFSNADYNSNIGINLQYNILTLKKWSSISYTDESLKKYWQKRKEAEYNLEIKKIEIENKSRELNLEAEVETKKTAIKKKQKEIKELQSEIQDEISAEVRDSSFLKIKKLELEIAILSKQVEQTQNDLRIVRNTSPYFWIGQAENEATLAKREALSLIHIRGFELIWLSFGYGISNNAFKHVDQNASVDTQISRKNNLRNEFNAQVNYFKSSPFRNNSFLMSAGLRFAVEDNFNSLKKTEVEETKSIGNDQIKREIISKFVAYQGEYLNDLKRWSLNFDLYYFFFENNRGAFHFFPKYSFGTSLNPYSNLGFGFLYGFSNKKESNNIVNAEIFVDLFDINNNNNSEASLFDRSNVGLRFTFPFNFNLK